MDSWWKLGEWSGYDGEELSLHSIECPFCSEKGNWKLEHRSEKKKPNSSKVLYFDTYKCGSCASYVMVFWSAGFRLHDYRVVPWALNLNKYPDYLPESVGRYWLQAHRNIKDENWDAAAVMTRSALQLTLRVKGAKGKTLKDEIDDLARKGELPPIMKDWSDNIRLLGNDSAHPELEDDETNPIDVKDAIEFLDFLIEYAFSLPKRISEYRDRSK
jgi:hypothetical protein